MRRVWRMAAVHGTPPRSTRTALRTSRAACSLAEQRGLDVDDRERGHPAVGVDVRSCRQSRVITATTTTTMSTSTRGCPSPPGQPPSRFAICDISDQRLVREHARPSARRVGMDDIPYTRPFSSAPSARAYCGGSKTRPRPAARAASCSGSAPCPKSLPLLSSLPARH